MFERKSIWIFLLITALILAACGGATPAPTQQEAEEAAATDEATQEPAATEEAAATEEPAAEPRILKVATTANITTWDPVGSFSTEAFYMGQIYEQLLRINPPGSAEEYTPLLAESWESNDDGTVWTFHLRDGVTFHDGEPMNAEAVKASIEAAADHAGASFIWLPLNSVEAVDDLTVQMNLSYSAPMDLVASSLYGAWIVSPKALEAAASDDGYFETGVDAGTGPYMLTSYTPDSEVVLEVNPNYWGAKPYFDTVLCLIVPEAVQQQQMLEGGQVDLAARLPNESLDSFRNNPDYQYYDEPSFFNYVGFFNALRPPLDNKMVRQALSYAIPYEDLITVGAQGLGTQSRGPVPEGVWPWSADVSQYTYDLEMAKSLLVDAGYPNGEGFPTLRLTYAAENPTEERFAPLIRDAYAELGITVDVEAVLFNQQWEEAKSDPANAQDIFLLLYWPTYSDAGSDNLWSMFHSSEAPFFNLSYWKNDEFDTTLDSAIGKTVSDRAASQAEYIDAMNLLVDEAPGLFFFDTRAVYVIPTYLKGYTYNLNYPFVPFFFAELSAGE